MSSSTLRFGKGVTAEIGFDVQILGAKNPLIMTDKNVVKTIAFRLGKEVIYFINFLEMLQIL
jgi:alcohol dehydrogenase class IV